MDTSGEYEKTNEVVRQFFAAFLSSDLGKVDLNALRSLFLPQAHIIKACGNPLVYTIDEFIAPRQKILTDGSLVRFSESEISQETKIFGDIAQRRCVYRKTGSLHGKPFSEVGVKFFHFVRIDRSWKISSILWEDERAGLSVPSDLIPH